MSERIQDAYSLIQQGNIPCLCMAYQKIDAKYQIKEISIDI